MPKRTRTSLPRAPALSSRDGMPSRSQMLPTPPSTLCLARARTPSSTMAGPAELPTSTWFYSSNAPLSELTTPLDPPHLTAPPPPLSPGPAAAGVLLPVQLRPPGRRLPWSSRHGQPWPSAAPQSVRRSLGMDARPRAHCLRPPPPLESVPTPPSPALLPLRGGRRASRLNRREGRG